MEKCYRCERDETEVVLVDAISNGEVVKFCEECIALENFPVLRASFSNPNKEKPYTVRERLDRMAGIKPAAKEIQKPAEDRWKQESLQKASIRNKPLNLVHNYHWQILMARKQRKISRAYLAKEIGEPEEAVKMIENQIFPANSQKIITKIEQYLNLKLQGESSPVQANQPARVLKFDQEAAKSLTISDLQRIKLEKEKLMNAEEEQGGKKEEIEENQEKKSWFSRIFSRKNQEAKEKEGIKESSLVEEDIELA